MTRHWSDFFFKSHVQYFNFLSRLVAHVIFEHSIYYQYYSNTDTASNINKCNGLPVLPKSVGVLRTRRRFFYVSVFHEPLCIRFRLPHQSHFCLVLTVATYGDCSVQWKINNMDNKFLKIQRIYSFIVSPASTLWWYCHTARILRSMLLSSASQKLENTHNFLTTFKVIVSKEDFFYVDHHLPDKERNSLEARSMAQMMVAIYTNDLAFIHSNKVTLDIHQKTSSLVHIIFQEKNTQQEIRHQPSI